MRQDDGPLPEEGTPARVQPPRWLMLLLANCTLIVLALLLVAIPAEFVFRYRYAHMIYEPRPVVKAVQQYLVLQPVIGFTWAPNISTAQNVRFDINDIKPEPLCTDSFGVINAPAAIAERSGGRAVDVVGLGDSFMEMANRGLYDAFHGEGLFFYSLAIHRQCPPQYDSILATWASDLKPKTIVYGLFENDFIESADYGAWRRSGIDWFAYHSGTWCGPPVGVGSFDRFLHRHTRGWNAFLRVIAEEIRGQRVSVLGPAADDIKNVVDRVREAAEFAKGADMRFVLVLIPGKETAKGVDTAESRAYDEVVRGAAGDGAELIDLRPIFRSQPDPAGLYYEKDGHWNARGIALAADIIVKKVKGGADESGSH